MTIRFPVAHFIQALHCHQVAISSHFRDNVHQTYRVHDHDLSRARDVIGHVIGHVNIRLAVGHFLLVVVWTQVSISLTVSEIFRSKHHVLIDTMLNRHCACAISHDVYPLCKILCTYFNFSPHFAYSLCHFHWSPMKNKECSLSDLMLKAKSSEKFLSPKICQFLTF